MTPRGPIVEGEMRGDDEVVQKYEELVRDEVATWNVDAPIEEEWGKVKKLLTEVAGTAFGHQKAKNQDWFAENLEHITPLLESKRQAALKHRLNPSEKTHLPTFVEANRVEEIINKTQRDVQILQDRLEYLQQRFESSLETISELRAELVLLPADKTKSQRAPRGNTAKRQAQPPSNKTGKVQSRPSEPPRNTRYDQVDTEGFTLVQKKRRQRHRQNYCGTAPGEPNLALRAATPRTSLYVSRLHASTTKQDVLDYIFARHKAGVFKDSPRLGVFVEALESRYVVGFNSFLLRVPTAHLDVFTSPVFWPKGVVFRRFRGRMRNATPKLN
ncbi:hypothetical protein NE865_11571 [Phthorimaea operculella]|nr:hypothetical protein NE865_11571 [Phthorimaea operculella]